MIQAILFDFDGVVCDSEPVYFEFKIDKMERMGLNPQKEDLKNHLGENFKALIYREYNDIENKEELIKEFYQEFDQLYIDYTKCLSPGIFEFVDYCHSNDIKCYICSNANLIKLNMAIEQLDLQQHFDKIYTSTMLGVSKPNPEFYYRILNDLNLSENEVIVIEDSAKGIQAAKDINITTIAKKEYLFNIDQSRADYRIDNFEEIIDILNQLNQ